MHVQCLWSSWCLHEYEHEIGNWSTDPSIPSQWELINSSQYCCLSTTKTVAGSIYTFMTLPSVFLNMLLPSLLCHIFLHPWNQLQISFALNILSPPWNLVFYLLLLLEKWVKLLDHWILPFTTTFLHPVFFKLSFLSLLDVCINLAKPACEEG